MGLIAASSGGSPKKLEALPSLSVNARHLRAMGSPVRSVLSPIGDRHQRLSPIQRIHQVSNSVASPASRQAQIRLQRMDARRPLGLRSQLPAAKRTSLVGTRNTLPAARLICEAKMAAFLGSTPPMGDFGASMQYADNASVVVPAVQHTPPTAQAWLQEAAQLDLDQHELDFDLDDDGELSEALSEQDLTSQTTFRLPTQARIATTTPVAGEAACTLERPRPVRLRPQSADPSAASGRNERRGEPPGRNERMQVSDWHDGLSDSELGKISD